MEYFIAVSLLYLGLVAFLYTVYKNRNKLKESYLKKLENEYKDKKQEYNDEILFIEGQKTQVDKLFVERQEELKTVSTNLFEAEKCLAQTISKQEEELENLDGIESKIESALSTAKKIAELKRQEELEKEKDNIDIYRLSIPIADLNDVKVIRSIEHLISNKDELNKVIWKLAYEKPFNELCARVLSTSDSCGIYKITNIENGKPYIGQAVSLKERLKSHVKCGIGIDTKNILLYNEMRKGDLTNFTFEVLEYCNKEELNDKEKFWIDYYQSHIFGYNMKR